MNAGEWLAIAFGLASAADLIAFCWGMFYFVRGERSAAAPWFLWALAMQSMAGMCERRLLR